MKKICCCDIFLLLFVIICKYVHAANVPFKCGFEYYALCDMEHQPDTDFHWERDVLSRIVSGRDWMYPYDGSWFITAKVSSSLSGEKAYINTPKLDYTGNVCISFYYFIQDNVDDNTVKFQVVNQNKGGESCPLIELSGHKGSVWFKAQTQTTIATNDKIGLIVTRDKGSGDEGDIGIDELAIEKGGCTGEGIVPTPPCLNTTGEAARSMPNISIIISAEGKSGPFDFYKKQTLISLEGDPSDWVSMSTPLKQSTAYQSFVQEMNQDVTKLGVNFWDRQIIWSNSAYGDIEYGRMDHDISDILAGKSTAHFFTSPEIGGIAVDWTTKNIYWTDQVYRWVVMTSLIGDLHSSHRTVVNKDLDVPSGIVVHPARSFLFWSDIGASPRISRSDLAGSEGLTVIGNNILKPLILDIDYKNDRLYWLDTTKEVIESCNFDGNNRLVFQQKSAIVSSLLGITIFQNYLFSIASDNNLYVMNIPTPSATIKKFPLDYERAYDIIAFGEDKQNFMISPCNNTKCEGFCVGKSNNTVAQCVCPDGKQLIDGQSCRDTPYPYSPTYLIQSGSYICIFDVFAPDLKPSEKVKNKYCPFRTGSTQSFGQLYEMNLLYMGSDSDMYMMPVRLGEKPRMLIQKAGNVKAISVDWISKNIFWADGSGFIKVANTRGRYGQVVLSVNGITGLVVNPLTGYLYWTNNTNHIGKAKMNGGSPVLLSTESSTPEHITLDYQTNRFYWSDSVSFSIHTMKTDGTGLKIISTASSTAVNGIAIFQNHITWTTKQEVNWAYKNMFVNETVRHNEGYVYSTRQILLYGKHSQPDSKVKKACSDNNGGCQHLCLTLPGGFACKCGIGYDLAVDGNNCVLANLTGPANMLITGEAQEKFLQFSTTSTKVRQFPVIKIVSPSALGVNKEAGVVFWTDLGIPSISRASLADGTEVKITVLPAGSKPMGLAVDEFTERIFYTDFTRNVIVSDDYFGTDNNVVLYALDRPVSITLDKQNKLVYWTNWGTFPGISVVTYEGNHVRVVVEMVNLVSPNGLVLDQTGQILYWCDTSLGRIESIQTNGDNRKLIANQYGSQFYGMTFDGRFLYVTDKNSLYIKKVHTTGGQIEKVGPPVFVNASGILWFDPSTVNTAKLVNHDKKAGVNVRNIALIVVGCVVGVVVIGIVLACLVQKRRKTYSTRSTSEMSIIEDD